MNALEHISANFSSILFAGFQHLPESAQNGWVYSMPRFVNRHTDLTVYYLTNDGELFTLDDKGNLHKAVRTDIKQPCVFFGRTINSFTPDDPLVMNASLRILYPIAIHIPRSYKKLNLTIIDDSTFIKPLPELEKAFFYRGNTQKEKLLLYPASIAERKGQLAFAKKVNKKALKGHKIIFCGSIKSQTYADICFETLNKRGIDYEFLKKVSKEELGELYRKAKLTLILSSIDYNPRTVYESMACGTPALLSRRVLLAKEVEPFCRRTSHLMLNGNVSKALDYPDSLPAILQQAAAFYTEERCYNKIFRKVLDSID